MAKIENLEGAIGWLIDPQNKWAINFDFKKGTNDQQTKCFTIDMWGVVPNGKPMQFKSRRKVTMEESLKTREQLISSDWVEYDF